MGNNNSKDGGDGGYGAPLSQTTSPASPSQERSRPKRSSVKRAESINEQLIPKTIAAAPTTSLESATGQSASSTRSSISRSRGRSSTQSSATQPTASATNTSKGPGGRTTSTSAKPSNISTSATPNRSVSPGSRTATGPSRINTDVPSLAPSPILDSSASPTPYYLPQPQFSRPPRLPLPIDEEEAEPGSPILSTVDVREHFREHQAEPVPIDDEETALPHNRSMLSSAASMDEEIEPEAMFAGDAELAGLPKVSTLLEWKEEGRSVYVTGTFCNWDKKYKLHRNGPSKDQHALSAIINITPGTHHILFLVDGGMLASRTMPTAVDHGGMLVNYLHVAVEDKGKATDRTRTSLPTIPPTPELRPTSSAATSSSAAPSSVPTRTPSQKQPRPSSQHQPFAPASQPANPPAPRIKKAPVTSSFHNLIPQFLVHLDAAEDSSRYARAAAVMDTQPQPPSLPMFLSKSILNGATPMKDDASVLILPNHTVLNHLATSSIRSGVLATSATTRYKNKYVTTILYKPTSDGSD